MLKVLDDKGNILLDMILSDELSEGVSDSDENPFEKVMQEIGKYKHTENGGELPNTASRSVEWAVFGILLATSGVVLRKKLN